MFRRLTGLLLAMPAVLCRFWQRGHCKNGGTAEPRKVSISIIADM